MRRIYDSMTRGSMRIRVLVGQAACGLTSWIVIVKRQGA
jgi:hypothetical protein